MLPSICVVRLGCENTSNCCYVAQCHHPTTTTITTTTTATTTTATTTGPGRSSPDVDGLLKTRPGLGIRGRAEETHHSGEQRGAVFSLPRMLQHTQAASGAELFAKHLTSPHVDRTLAPAFTQPQLWNHNTFGTGLFACVCVCEAGHSADVEG